jgi:hypothetical protein
MVPVRCFAVELAQSPATRSCRGCALSSQMLICYA